MTTNTLAALEARHLAHVRIICHGVIQAVLWPLLTVPAETPFNDVVQRLWCSHCGRRPDPAEVSPWASWMASGGGGGAATHKSK